MRLGLILPSSNTVMEEELNKYVIVHSTRISLKTVNENHLKEMNQQLSKALNLVSDCNPDFIIYGCTSGSFVENFDQIFRESSIPAMTTSQAVISALRVLKTKTVSIATPYIDEINLKERKFLESKGFEVRDIKGLGFLSNLDIGKQQDRVAYTLAKSLKSADTIFISCTNFRTFNIIGILEEELKIPIISSNSASLWAALKLTHNKYKINLGELLEDFL